MPSSPPLSLSSLPIPPSSRDPTPGNPWSPYTNPGDFDANVAMILIILVCALVCALALNTAIRCFIRSRPRASDRPIAGKLTQKDPAEIKLPPALVFSAGMKLAGAEAECAICLSEFVNGEGVRVLPRCKHGYHVKCIEEWLVSRSSCPTCRTSYLTNSPEDGGPTRETVAEP